MCLAAAGRDHAALLGPRLHNTKVLRGFRALSHAAGPPAGERSRRARAAARLCPTCPGRWEEREGERKALPLGRAGPSWLRSTRKKEIAAAQLQLRRAGSLPPGARPRQPLLLNFFFLVRPTRKVEPGRGRREGRARGGSGRKGSGARGSAAEQRKCPTLLAPARGPAHPGPPPRCDFGGPSPTRQCWRRRQMWPGCPEEPTMRGRQNKRVPLLLLSSLSLALPESRAESRASRGRSPGDPWPRAPRFPRGPPLAPTPAPQAQGPARSDSWSPGIRPYCPRGAPRARPGSRAVPARAPTGLREQEPGAPRKPSPRRRRYSCPLDAAALRVSFFIFFYANPDGKVTAYFAFINSHHNNKNPGATGSGGPQAETPQAGAHPRAPSRDTGPGAQTQDVLGRRLRVLRPPSPPRVAQ